MARTTTIRVSTETRDRLKAQAAAAHLTLGEHLADTGDRALRFEALRKAIAQEPAAGRRAYERERDAWLDADLGA